jgi:hypothetical protein
MNGHGDPHMDNVIYDHATDRALLIDFEVIHDKSVPAGARHADDLLVFLQDLMGRVEPQKIRSLQLTNSTVVTNIARELLRHLQLTRSCVTFVRYV